MYTRLVYATVADLPENLQGLPDAQQRIEAASDIITWLLSNSYYAVDDVGYPANPSLVEVFKEATIQQTIFADDKYGGVELDDLHAPSQLGSLKFSGATEDSGRNPNYGTGIRQNVSPSAWYLLKNIGLIKGWVQ